MQSAALFLKMGKWLWHFPQPRFQAVGLARWCVKLKINEEVTLVYIRDFQVYWTPVLQWTLVHCWNTLVFQRCFLRALARAPTSFIGFAAGHLLHLRKSKNLLESTLMWSDVSFNPQLNVSVVVPSASKWTTCVLQCLYRLPSQALGRTHPPGIDRSAK